MQFTAATILAIATAVFALPNEKRSVDPASASLAVFSVLPSSLQAVALTNPAAAASEIHSEFLTGTPTWFSNLPTDVQTYLITSKDSSAVPTTAALAGTGGSLFSSNSSATGKFLNSTAAASTAAATTSGAALSSAGSSASGHAGSSSSTGGASMPTQVIGAGIAGALGIFGMLAL